MGLSRRALLVGVTAALLVACLPPSDKELDDADDLGLEALLNSRPFSAPTGPAPAPGIYALGLDTGEMVLCTSRWGTGTIVQHR